MRRAALITAILALALASGCVSKLTMDASMDPAPAAPTQEEAHVVFLRPTSFGGGIQAPIIEVVDEKALSFVTIVSAWTKILYVTKPGQHIFVVGGEASNALEANLDGGKTYYVEIEPHMGMWKASFTLNPITFETATSESFKKDFSASQWRKNGPDTLKWYQDNIRSLRVKAEEAMRDRAAMPIQGRPMVRPEYGLETPLP